MKRVLFILITIPTFLIGCRDEAPVNSSRRPISSVRIIKFKKPAYKKYLIVHNPSDNFPFYTLFPAMK